MQTTSSVSRLLLIAMFWLMPPSLEAHTYFQTLFLTTLLSLWQPYQPYVEADVFQKNIYLKESNQKIALHTIGDEGYLLGAHLEGQYGDDWLLRQYDHTHDLSWSYRLTSNYPQELHGLTSSQDNIGLLGSVKYNHTLHPSLTTFMPYENLTSSHMLMHAQPLDIQYFGSMPNGHYFIAGSILNVTTQKDLIIATIDPYGMVLSPRFSDLGWHEEVAALFINNQSIAIAVHVCPNQTASPDVFFFEFNMTYHLQSFYPFEIKELQEITDITFHKDEFLLFGLSNNHATWSMVVIRIPKHDDEPSITYIDAQEYAYGKSHLFTNMSYVIFGARQNAFFMAFFNKTNEETRVEEWNLTTSVTPSSLISYDKQLVASGSFPHNQSHWVLTLLGSEESPLEGCSTQTSLFKTNTTTHATYKNISPLFLPTYVTTAPFNLSLSLEYIEENTLCHIIRTPSPTSNPLIHVRIPKDKVLIDYNGVASFNTSEPILKVVYFLTSVIAGIIVFLSLMKLQTWYIEKYGVPYACRPCVKKQRWEMPSDLLDDGLFIDL